MEFSKSDRPASGQSTDLFGGVFGKLNRIRHERDPSADLGNDVGVLRAFGLLEGAWAPLIDLYVTGEAFQLRAELPGLKRGDIELELHGDTLILHGERKRPLQQEGESFYRVERIYGHFHRAITLQGGVKFEDVSAFYKDGVLDVRLPKMEAAIVKQIDIK